MSKITVLNVDVPKGTGEFILRSTVHCDKGSISWFDKWTKKETISLIPKGIWLIKSISESIIILIKQ